MFWSLVSLSCHPHVTSLERDFRSVAGVDPELGFNSRAVVDSTVRGVFPSQEMLTESTEPSSFKALACMHFLHYLVDSSPHDFYCLAASGLGGGT